MNSESENFDWIESYLNGTLTEEQQAAFESKLQADAAFAEEVELHRTVQELVIDQALLDLKAKMVTEYRPKYRDTGSSGPNSGNTFTIIGIVVLATLTAGMFYFQRPLQSSTPLVVVTEKTQPLSLPQPANSSGLNPTPELASVSMERRVANPSDWQKEVKKVRTVRSHSPAVDSAAAPDQNGIKIAPVLPLAERPLVETYAPIGLSSETKLIPPGLTPAKALNESEPADAPWDCSNLKMAVKVNVKESCSDFPSGKITYDNTTVEGGEPPYRFSLDNGLSFTKANQFEHLSPGIYYLTIEDKRGCRYTLEEAFEVKSLECSAPKEYAFAPEQGETCKFLFAENRDGNLRIFNRSGVLVYSVSIRNGYPAEWNGQGNQSVAVTMGSYRFTFEDVKGKKTGGTITLVR